MFLNFSKVIAMFVLPTRNIKVGSKVLVTLLSHDNGEFGSCQLCGHEQGLLDELVQPTATVLCLLRCVER